MTFTEKSGIVGGGRAAKRAAGGGHDRRRTAENSDGRGEIRRVLFFVGVAAEKQGGRAGKRVVRGDMPFVHAGRAVHFAAQNADEQRLRLRLRVLPQPAERGRPARERHARRDVRAGHGLLPAQFHRRAVFVLRRPEIPRLHDGTPVRDHPQAAGGVQIQRLYSSQRHPARGQGAHRKGRRLRRPHELQRGAPLRKEPAPARPAKDERERLFPLYAGDLDQIVSAVVIF